MLKKWKAHRRNRALRALVKDYEAEFGVITEAELIDFSRSSGVPYRPPGSSRRRSLLRR